jgi:hypothetical protein
MLDRRLSRLSSLATSPISHQTLPTGKGFGSSNLQLDRLPERLLSVVISSTAVSDLSIPVKKSSPLIVEVGKILVLACWLWCSIGANFCLESIGSIASFGTQDI